MRDHPRRLAPVIVSIWVMLAITRASSRPKLHSSILSGSFLRMPAVTILRYIGWKTYPVGVKVADRQSSEADYSLMRHRTVLAADAIRRYAFCAHRGASESAERTASTRQTVDNQYL